MFRRACVVAVFASWLVGTPVQASEVLRPSLAKIAAAVAKIVKARGAAAINIGQFVGPVDLRSNAGPGIQQVLADELKRLGVSIAKSGAALGVRGEYLYTSTLTAPDSPFKQIRLKVVLTDGSGQPLTSLNQDVAIEVRPDDLPPGIVPPGGSSIPIREGEINLDTFTGGEEAAALLGVTWDFEKSGLGFDVTKDVVLESYRNPTAQIVDNRAARSSASSPYFLEVFVNGLPRRLRLEDGQPVVDLNKGEVFALRFTNRAPHDAAAYVTLDGVNSFAFSKERRPDGGRLTRYVVEKERPVLLIKGWHDTFTTTTTFKVTDFSESAAALVGSTSGLGMITVLVRSSWKPAEERAPRDEPQEMTVGAQAGTFGSTDLGSSAPGIGFDKKVRENTRFASGRETGVVRSIITIRYRKPELDESEKGPLVESRFPG